MALNPARTVSNPRIAKLIELEVAGRIKPEHQQELDTYRAQGLAPKDTGASLTEAQSKSTGFYNRAIGADKEFLSQPGAAQEGPGILGDAARSILPSNIINSAQSSQRQQAEQAKQDFIRASLRYESGAAIGQSEFDAQEKIFFPQTGDDPATIAQKAEARRRVIESLKVAGGDGPDALRKDGPTREVTASEKIDELAGVQPHEEEGAYRDPRTGRLRVNIGVNPQAPVKVDRPSGILGTVDAAVRGIADTATLGFADEIAAAGDTIFNGGTMADNLRRQRGIDKYDQQNNYGARLTGQLAGGLALPTGGASGIAELARIGGTYGAGYGFGSGEGSVTDRLISAGQGGLAGAALGAGGGYVASRFGRGGPPSGGGGGVAADKYAAGQSFGIDLPLAATGSRAAAIADNTMSNMLPSANVMQRSREGLRGQVSSALDNVSRQYGEGSTAYNMGEAAQTGARKWLTKLDETVGKAYDAIPIASDRSSRVDNTKQALTDLIDVFPSNPKLREIFQNQTLARYLDAFTRDTSPVMKSNAAGGGGAGRTQIATNIDGGTIGWDDLKRFRSIIGEQIGQLQFGEAPLKSQLRRVYSGLTEDMRKTAESAGPDALRKFDRANNLYAAGQQRIEKAMVDLLGKDGNKASEATGGFLRGISQSGKSTADIRKLTVIRKSMPSEEWGQVAGSLVQMLGQPARSEGRQFSAQTFIQNYDDLAPEAKRLLFADRGRRELASELDKFAGVIRDLSSVDALRNTSNTAGQVISGSLIGPAAFAHPALTAAGVVLNNLGARALTNKEVVKWATGYTRAMKAAARQGNPEIAQERALVRLARIAAREPEIANDILPVQQALQQQSRAVAAPEQQESDGR